MATKETYIEDLKDSDVVGFYEHYKGTTYYVYGIAIKATNGLEGRDIVYSTAGQTEYFTRDIYEWFEDVEVDGELVPRYKRIFVG